SARGMFVTLACGVFNPESEQLVFVNAGHLPGLLLPASGKPQLLQAHAPPLGVLDEIACREEKYNLAACDLWLFSDGVTECRTRDGIELGIGGLLKLLQATREKTPREPLQFVVQQLLGDGSDARDDLTLVRLSTRT
ncbi:MAG: serine/threonine-protein phosphatase, partial [Gammaproteobacteria bacterium]|nr:serine/threonine-protein phosphatase [Gammaproteobacteria bacterium]